MRPARTDAYEHTISGLLTKRREMLTEAERIRDRLAEIRNDLQALDRTLATLGFQGDLEGMMPRQKRMVVFGRGELSRAIFDELRHAGSPLTSRDIACSIVAMRGEDARDRRYIADLTKRVCKALRAMREEGHVRSVADAKGNLNWELRQ